MLVRYSATALQLSLAHSLTRGAPVLTCAPSVVDKCPTFLSINPRSWQVRVSLRPTYRNLNSAKFRRTVNGQCRCHPLTQLEKLGAALPLAVNINMCSRQKFLVSRRPRHSLPFVVIRSHHPRLLLSLFSLLRV